MSDSESDVNECGFFRLRDITESDLHTPEGYQYITNVFSFVYVLCTLRDDPEQFFGDMVQYLPKIDDHIVSRKDEIRENIGFRPSEECIRFEFSLSYRGDEPFDVPIWTCELWLDENVQKEKHTNRDPNDPVGLLLVDTKKYNKNLKWVVPYFVLVVNHTTKFLEDNIPSGTVMNKDGRIIPPNPIARKRLN